MTNEDREYFSEMWDKYAAMLFRLCFVYSKSRELAEDAVSELFLKLMEKRPVFKSDEHEKAFLIRSAVNQCKDMLKKERRRVDGGELTPYAETPEEIRLMDYIASLPPKYRAVIYLYHCQGYSTAETARLLSLREGTVRSQLSRGRELLKKLLNEGGINCV